MKITDFVKDHKYTKTVYKFYLTINEKDVEGTYEIEDSGWLCEDDVIIENIDDLTDEEQDAVIEYVTLKIN